MARRRFFVQRESIRDGWAVLPADQAHHLRNVLRLETGSTVEIFDGEGRGYVGEVELKNSDVFIRNIQNIPPEDARIHLILAAALIKTARFEWILQKATELGVDEIVPLRTHRSEIRIPDNKLNLRLERWERIVLEASKQCRRFTAPRVREPLHFSDFIFLKEFWPCTRLLLSQKHGESWLPDPSTFLNRFVLCIGPEGGWDSSEIEQAQKAGYKSFSLGPRILRAETAALAAVSIIQYQISSFTSHK